MKKIIAVTLCTILIASIFGACGKKSGAAIGNSGMEIPQEITEYWDKYDYDNFDPADLLVTLGDAVFTLDNDNTATGEFVAGSGKPLSLSLTDSTGLTWTLDIPVDALLDNETITMTAMKDATLGGYSKLDGGVQFSPDGLTFLAPATLTVTGGDYSEDAYMLQAGHDGGNVTYVAFETTSDSLMATLNHFSTSYSVYPDGPNGPRLTFYTEQEYQDYLKEQERIKQEQENAEKADQDDWDKYDKKALKQFQNAVSAARKVCSQPVKVPEPPSVTMRCTGDHSGKTPKSNFDKQFIEPEKPVIDALDAAFYALIGSYRGEGSNSLGLIIETYTDVKTALRDRLLEKTRQLIETYKYREEKFINVAYAWCVVKISSIGIGMDDELYKWADAEMKKWAKEVWNELIGDVVEKHDYRQANHLGQFVVAASLMVGDIGQTNWQELLGNAMTFSVKYDTTYVMHNENGYGIDMSLSAEANDIRVDQVDETIGLFGESIGIGQYNTFTHSDPDTTCNIPAPFEFNVIISNIDPCGSKTVDIAIDRFGAEHDLIIYDDGDGRVEMPWDGVFNGWFIAANYSRYNESSGFVTFNTELKNGSEIAAKIELSQTENEKNPGDRPGIITTNITLHHTPKGEVYIK